MEFLNQNEVVYNEERILRPDYYLPQDAAISVNGKLCRLNARIIILFHKPMGYVCSHKAQKNQKTIFSLLPESYQKFFFAGRLDIDSRGLLVLSNDGSFIHDLSHPSKKENKIYLVRASRPLAEKEIAKMEHGFYLKKEFLKIEKIESLKKPAHYRFTLHHGKNREIRRLLEWFHIATMDLCRVKFSKFLLGKLKEGQYQVYDESA